MMISRYLRMLVTLQVVAARHGIFLSDEAAAYDTGRLVGLLPLLHGGAVLAVAGALSRTLRIPVLTAPYVLCLLFLPFVIIAVFVRYNLALFKDVEAEFRYSSSSLSETRRREAKAFALRSGLFAFISFGAPIVVYLFSSGT